MISSKQPIKRLVVRNFKGQKLPDDFETSSWESLKAGIVSILGGQQPSQCLELLYKTCENMVRCNLSTSLYSKIYAEIELFNKNLSLRTQAEFKQSTTDQEFLEKVTDVWNSYLGQVKIVENVLMYLDRCHILQKPELFSIQYTFAFSPSPHRFSSKICILHFRNYSLSDTKIFDRLTGILLSSLSAIRLSKAMPDLKLIQNCIEMFIDTGLFESFQQDLFTSTTHDISAQIEASFRSHQKLKLLIFNVLFEEKLFASLGMPKDTVQQIFKIVEDLSLTRHIVPLITEAVPVLMESYVKGAECPDIVEPPLNQFEPLAIMNDQYANLKMLAWLANKANVMNELKRQWSKYIKTYGSKLLQASTIKDNNAIESLLQFKTQLEQILANVFDNDSAFNLTMKESFETFVNTHEVLVASLLAGYFDVLLKEGKPASASEKLGDEEMLAAIGNLVQIFRMLTSKDIFEAHYKEYLASRLILGRSCSMSAEKDVVSRFKLECGASFTSRLEGMFKDMESSIEMWNGFRQELKDAELLKTRIKLGATVISSGIWPHPPSIDAKLPSLVDNMESAFEKYYVDKHSGRLLSWNHALGSVIMKASFKAGAKELQVSIPQALILLAFANEDRLTYNAIQKKTGLADAELQDILLSLCDAHRHQVLISEVSAEGHIKKNDFFAVNDSFTSRLHRIRLISSGTKDKIDAKAVVGTILVEDRQHQIDAAIVRLLKQEKRKSIQDVVAAVKAKLNLSVLDADIDRRIESLIERDFIVKDKENLAFLLYVL